ncbi:hypothetical protein, partial [Streptomyces sp. 1222.5]|uniref:hypothetical protein n=1 Tax=Streptomyces sp. 1222.5 TaxID=1881026 RepID=UPI003D73F65E
MSGTVVHLHKNTDPPSDTATVTTLTVVPEPPAPSLVPLWVRSGRAIKMAATHDNTRTAARAVA